MEELKLALRRSVPKLVGVFAREPEGGAPRIVPALLAGADLSGTFVVVVVAGPDGVFDRGGADLACAAAISSK